MATGFGWRICHLDIAESGVCSSFTRHWCAARSTTVLILISPDRLFAMNSRSRRMEFSVVTKTSGDNSPWAVTWPVLENDSTPLERSSRNGIRSR
jgi:hypothetical protein